MGNALHALALALNNLWTVGADLQEGGGRITSGHWDGHAWITPPVPVPSPIGDTPDGELKSVTARGPDDIWAAGVYYDAIPGKWLGQTLITHWDGTRWSTIPSPSTPGVLNSLTGLVAVPGGGLWAVGGTQNALNSPLNALILRYTPAVCRSR
jgi:hypothetical protein